MPEIAFVGLDHAGQTYSACWQAKGLDVIGITAPHEFPLINEPDMPPPAPWTDDIGRVRGCPVVVISLDVWDNSVGSLTAVRLTIRLVKPYLWPDQALVLLSQVPTGFAREVARNMPCPVYYLADTLRLGHAVERCMNPEQFIVGSNTDTITPGFLKFAEMLRQFDCPIHRMSYESAEMAKVAINAWLCGEVAATNTLADACRAVGADWESVATVLRHDARIGPQAYLRPGRIEGHIRRDLERLAEVSDSAWLKSIS